MARALESRWSELNDKQKERYGSKSAFSDAKNDYRSQQNITANAGGGDAYNSTNRSRKAGDKLKELRAERETLREDKAGNKEALDQLHGRIKSRRTGSMEMARGPLLRTTMRQQEVQAQESIRRKQAQEILKSCNSGTAKKPLLII